MSYIFLQELGEESSAESFADIPASVLSKLNLTHEKFCCNASEMESCHVSPFGTMCEHSTGDHGEARLTSCVEDSHARIFPALEKEPVSKVQEAECGWKWRESFVRYHPDSSLWKTRQCSLLAGLDEFSETWPKWGTMQDGECWGLTPLGLPTKEIGYGFLPTPTKHNSKEGAYPSEFLRNTPTLATYAGGKINPDWTEWLMDWPIKMTDLRPLEMDKFQAWLDSHGKL